MSNWRQLNDDITYLGMPAMHNTLQGYERLTDPILLLLRYARHKTFQVR